MFRVGADGALVQVARFSNSWGFAPMVWGTLVRRYQRDIPGVAPDDRYIESQSDYWPLLWEVAPRLSLQPWECDVLIATYDNVVICGADLVRMAESMERFADVHPVDRRACSLKEIATCLHELAREPSPPDICFNGTSVVNLWWVADENDEDDEGRAYNVKTDTKHWYAPLAGGMTAAKQAQEAGSPNREALRG